MDKKWKWTAHWHVSQGRGHRVVALLPETEKVMVGITFRGVEQLYTIPWKGTVYACVDVRRRVVASTNSPRRQLATV
jgi:hypothetical protein